MPDLDACYFCGGVEDVTREPVTAGDRTAADTDTPTVALCPSCRDRLDALFDALDSQRPDTTDTATTSTTIDVKPGDTPPDQADGQPQPSEADPVAGDDDPPDQGVTIDPPDDDQPTDDATVDRPEGYGKVLRFLRNRELPMARTRVVELVGSAYELRHDEVEAVLDYAIDHDTLAETDDEIRRP